MSVSYPTKLLLAFRSGGQCAFPGCGTLLTVEGDKSKPVVIGEAAHIAGEKEDAARFDLAMTDGQRDHYNNLVYLCSNHHTQIDKQEADFSTERLHEIKAEHEKKVRTAMVEAFSSVGFQELEEATRWIMEVQPSQTMADFSLIPPEDKLKKNALGNSSRMIITMGLSVTREVGAYIESVSQVDANFPERLKAGFLSEYFRLKREGSEGDTLFDLMCVYAGRGMQEQSKKMAGCAVLIYLFESCEVFEK
jgi:hypothetical protein